MKEFDKTERLAEKFFRLQMLLHRQQIANLRAFGPSGSPLRGQGRILSILKMQPTISQKQLSFLLDMRQQSLSELLAKLEKNGQIARAQSEDDKRAVVITLTDKGREASDDASDAAPDAEKVFDCLTEEEQSQLGRMLDKLIEALDDRTDGPREDFRRPFGPMHPRGFEPPFGFHGPFVPDDGFGPEGSFGPEGPFGPWGRGRRHGEGCGCDRHGEGRENGCGQGEHRREHHGEAECRGEGHPFGDRAEFHGRRHREERPFGQHGERRGAKQNGGEHHGGPNRE